MSLRELVAVAGAYEHPTRWAPEKTEFQIMAESARGALEDAGLTLDDVFHLYTLFFSTLRYGNPADPAFWRLAGNTARVLIDGMFSRSKWKPRPVEEIIREIDLMLTKGGDTG